MMKQLYLVRHGIGMAELSNYGRGQIRSLGERLHEILPEKVKISLVSSPVRRAWESAEELLPFLNKKSKNDVYIQRDDSFALPKYVAISYKGAINQGKEIIPVIESYFENNDIVFIVSHRETISPLVIAIPAHYEIPFSGSLKPEIRPPDDENLISTAMKRNNLPREEAIKWLIDEYPNIFLFPPEIPEASALSFDLEAKVAKMIRSGLGSI